MIGTEELLAGKTHSVPSLPLGAVSWSGRLEGGNGNDRDGDEAGQSVDMHPKTIFKSPWIQ